MQAALALIRSRGCQVAGKRAVVLGRSNVVGLPLSLLLLRMDATVTVCHSKTQGLADVVREVCAAVLASRRCWRLGAWLTARAQADIVVAAAGKPELVQPEWLKQGALVIDVGYNVVPDASAGGFRVCGDVLLNDEGGCCACWRACWVVGPVADRVAGLLDGSAGLGDHTCAWRRWPYDSCHTVGTHSHGCAISPAERVVVAVPPQKLKATAANLGSAGAPELKLICTRGRNSCIHGTEAVTVGKKPLRTGAVASVALSRSNECRPGDLDQRRVATDDPCPPHEGTDGSVFLCIRDLVPRGMLREHFADKALCFILVPMATHSQSETTWRCSRGAQLPRTEIALGSNATVSTVKVRFAMKRREFCHVAGDTSCRRHICKAPRTHMSHQAAPPAVHSHIHTQSHTHTCTRDPPRTIALVSATGSPGVSSAVIGSSSAADTLADTMRRANWSSGESPVTRVTSPCMGEPCKLMVRSDGAATAWAPGRVFSACTDAARCACACAWAASTRQVIHLAMARSPGRRSSDWTARSPRWRCRFSAMCSCRSVTWAGSTATTMSRKSGRAITALALAQDAALLQSTHTCVQHA